MGKKKKKNKRDRRGPHKKAPAEAPARLDPERTAEQIRLAITEGNTREALRLSKALFGQEASGEAELLLSEAYGARGLALLSSGLVQEAAALVDIAFEKHTVITPSLMDAAYGIWVRTREFSKLLNGYDEKSKSDRARVDNAIRRWLTEPRALARSKALPKDHSLISAASAVADAFEQVTKGPVAARDIQLREVSRRSPFAPWVSLIRAIAAFYEKNDEAARTGALSVTEESAPYPLVRVLIAMIDDTPPAAGSKASTLWRKVLARRVGVMEAMNRVEKAFDLQQEKRISKEIRTLMKEVQRGIPSLRTPLMQHLSVRGFWMDIPSDMMYRAMGGVSTKNAVFWRLFAVSYDLEVRKSPTSETLLQDCIVWNEFLYHAKAEGLITGGSVEEAAVYLRMIRNFVCLSTFSLADYRFRVSEAVAEGQLNILQVYEKGQPDELAARIRRDRTGEFVLFPESLFERAVSICPTSDIFAMWYEWTRKTMDPWQTREQVLLSWHDKLPGDVKPLICLAEMALDRKAYTKVLKFVEKARASDPLNANLSRIRRITLSAIALRHLKQGKKHLVDKDIEVLSTLAEQSDTAYAVYIGTLRALSELMAGDRAAAQSCLETSSFRDVDGLVVEGMLKIISGQCGIDGRKLKPRTKTPGKVKAPFRYAESLTRLVGISKQAGIPIGIPSEWTTRLLKEAAKDLTSLGVSSLIALSEAALEAGAFELLYLVSNSALALTSSHRARFLWFRGHSLAPRRMWARPAALFHAAASLARRQGDTSLADNAMKDAQSVLDRGLPDTIVERAFSKLKIDISDEKIASLVHCETNLPTYPLLPYADPLEINYREAWLDNGLCNCPECRAARGEYVDPWEFEDDDELDDELDGWDDFEDPEPDEDLPPAVLFAMLNAMGKLNKTSSRKDFERAAEILIGELGVPDGVPAAAIPMILEMMVKSGDGRGIPFAPDMFSSRKGKNKRRKSR